MQPSPSPHPERTIADACGGAFTERAQRKGVELFAAGQAAIEGIGPEMALVSVQDERDAPYRVAIDVAELDTRDTLRVECQCAFFTQGHPCGHVYAGLLALEAGGDGTRLISPRAVERRLDVVTHRTGLPLGEDAFFDVAHAFSRVGPDAAANGGIAASGSKSSWRSRLETLRRSAVPPPPPTSGSLEALELVLEPERSETVGAPVIVARARRRDGPGLGPVQLSRRDLDRVATPVMREALEPWLACPPLGQRVGADALAPDPGLVAADTRRVPTGLQRAVFSALSGSLRFGVGGDPLTLDDGEPWQLRLRIARADGVPRAEGWLRRGEADPRLLDEAQLVLRDGWVVLDGQVARFDPGPSFDWVRHLRREGPISAEDGDEEELLVALAKLPALPRLELGEGYEAWEIVTSTPLPALAIGGIDTRARRAKAELAFVYGDLEVELGQADAVLVDLEAKRLVPRDLAAERSWLRRLLSSGLETEDDDRGLLAKASAIADIEHTLVDVGARVERDGVRLRSGGKSRLRLESGIDWFEVDGVVDFDGTEVGLAAVLQALRDRSDRVALPDGTEGVIPSAEARRLRALAGLGARSQGKLRFSRTQAILLDALIGGEESVERDQSFRDLAASLRGDLSIVPSAEPEGFRGELRPYQRLGLGWLEVLRRLGLGGCLADDMGLGKTVQVLALLTKVHRAPTARPSLVVAPRSLLFNWKQEAERFAPELDVVEYSGQQRSSQLDTVHEADVLLTTFGTLRRDIDVLAGLEFEYVVLDEAQTIKNHAAQVSRASRSLRSRHRLALSGTPVENDVSELWSIFEFLNPRMLGGRRDFVRMAQGEALGLIGRGLAPLMLRRRKEDVLAELPEKTELTVVCDLSPEERRLYDELRLRFRRDIDAKASGADGQMLRTEVLEALLRLRQVACHPGLVDEKRKRNASTKVETLIAHLEEVIAEGHKALVFSQFVKLLDIVRGRLDQRGIRHAYLDGQVRDRQAVVDQFQNDDGCAAFLISLRAGGLGLNLTAADYVFILDPWWNPAVEAQAIDRAHRIGQTRPVFAYRYIARDTVEEKILALHRDKRALAEALIGGDVAQAGKLSLDELRLLLQ